MTVYRYSATYRNQILSAENKEKIFDFWQGNLHYKALLVLNTFLRLSQSVNQVE